MVIIRHMVRLKSVAVYTQSGRAEVCSSAFFAQHLELFLRFILPEGRKLCVLSLPAAQV